jgi:hypothetical protein
MLTEQQKKFADHLSLLAGMVLAEAETGDVKEYVDYFAQKIQQVATQPKPEIPQLVDCGASVLDNIAQLSGNAKFMAVATVVKDTVDAIVEDGGSHPIIDLFKAGIALKKTLRAA